MHFGIEKCAKTIIQGGKMIKIHNISDETDIAIEKPRGRPNIFMSGRGTQHVQWN